MSVRRFVGGGARGLAIALAALGATLGAAPAARGQAFDRAPARPAVRAPDRGPARTPERAARPRAVALRLSPHAGDTVRTRFEQTVRVTPRAAAARAAGEGGEGAPSSAMLVIARSIVERVDANGAVLVAVTDSVAIRAAGAPPAALERMRRGMQGRRAELRVAPDGALAATAAPFGAGGLAAATPLRLPGTLPAATVAPGATWRRALAVPSWGAAGAPPHLDVLFRFDSVAGEGERAYVSLRGRVHGDAAGAEDDATDGGQVEGGLVVDLVRGWVVESWATFRMDGVVAGAAGPEPVKVVVTQRLKAY